MAIWISARLLQCSIVRMRCHDVNILGSVYRYVKVGRRGR